MTTAEFWLSFVRKCWSYEQWQFRHVKDAIFSRLVNVIVSYRVNSGVNMECSFFRRLHVFTQRLYWCGKQRQLSKYWNFIVCWYGCLQEKNIVLGCLKSRFCFVIVLFVLVVPKWIRRGSKWMDASASVLSYLWSFSCPITAPKQREGKQRNSITQS